MSLARAAAAQAFEAQRLQQSSPAAASLFSAAALHMPLESSREKQEHPKVLQDNPEKLRKNV